MNSDPDAREEGDFSELPSRTALDEALAAEFRRRVLAEPGCIKFTMIRHQGLGPQRESLKPVLLRGEVVWQAEQFNGFIRVLFGIFHGVQWRIDHDDFGALGAGLCKGEVGAGDTD